MKKNNKIILATAVIAFTGLLIYTAGRHKKEKRMLAKIAEEGYETAPDVIFPGKVTRNTKLQYGPVLPV